MGCAPVTAWLMGAWLGLFQATAADLAPTGSSPALVLVALPTSADAAMVEALHRLRGEATSVGFDVRLVEPGASLTRGRLDGGWEPWPPAALVTFVRREAGERGLPSLEVTFQERATGKVSIAQITAPEPAEGEGRAEVIVAVRAVDFIRARMFDTLVGRRVEPSIQVAAAPPPSPPRAPPPRFSLSGGLVWLGTPSGFSPSFLPRVGAGFAPTRWLRISISAAGLGTRPERATVLGTVSLDQRLLAAELAWVGPRWHRLRPVVTLAGGEYRVTVRGDGSGSNLGRTVTLSSPGGLVAAGIAIDLGPHVTCEVQAGTLWLENRVQVATSSADLGSMGRPSAFGGASLGAAF
jgi:hypothetical protein